MSAENEGGGRPRRGIGTRAVHGQGGPKQGSLTTPIVQSSTFVFDSAKEMRRYLDGDPDHVVIYRGHNVLWENQGDATFRDASDRIVYNTTTGQLFYDADGSGAGAAQLIATFQGAPAIAATDITVL